MNNTGRKLGRPRKALLKPEHADLMRKGVKAFCSYYGVRLKDLSHNRTFSWIAAAMRQGPMTVETAQALADQLLHPDPRLVGKKRPKGASLKQVWSVLATGPQQADPRLASEPAAQYIGAISMVTLIMRHYFAPLPGSAVFVMPGASESLASLLTNEICALGISKSKRVLIHQSLANFFELCEKPLETELGRKLVPRLTVLGLVATLGFRARVPWTEEETDDLVARVKDATKAEKRRSVALKRR